MEYASYVKCTFISSTHVVFDFKIFRGKPFDIQTYVAGEGNIIINEELDYYPDAVNMLDENFDDQTNFNNEIEEITKKCIERAKWIFNKN